MTQDEVKTIMHERICALLEEYKRNTGESFRELERKMGCSEGGIKDIKNNTKMLKTGTVVRFADYFGVRADWILGRCDESEKHTKPGRITERGTERMEAAERLTRLLEQNGMDPADLAREIGVSYQAVYSAATGVSLSEPWIQIAYAEYFGVTVDWLLGMEE